MNVHFIAIGGAIMHNLAICLQNLGHRVSGSDDVIFDPSRSHLAKAGLLPQKEGFFKENINENLDAIILGMHAKKDNVELQEALRLGLKIYSFPEFIYEQSKNKKRVVIAGSHGKTTTTAMIMHVLKTQNIAFDYMVGSSLEGFERSVQLSDAPLIILEGDEYLSSPIEMQSKFHFYRANIAMITGIAWDHINVFPTLESYHETFARFVTELNENAQLIWFAEDEVLQQICPKTQAESIAYRTPIYEVKENTTYIVNNAMRYALKIFGKHNMQNLEGARKVCEQLGISATDFYKAISSFKGTARRLEKLNTSKNRIAFKDFAHSPSKLQATIKAVKEQFPQKKLIACMELHTYSSTNVNFLQEFKNTMNSADISIIFMSEKAFAIKNKQAIADESIYENFNHSAIHIFRDAQELEQFILAQNLAESVLLLMSSGNFDGIPWENALA